MDNREIYEKRYLPFIVKWGKLTSWLTIPLMFLPSAVLVAVFGAKLQFSALATGCIAILSASFAMYIADPLAVFPALGTPGMYPTYLSGNSKQIRVPAALSAQAAAGVEQGSPEGGIMSCIGVCTSIFISTGVMTVMVLTGNGIIALLPPRIIAALPMLLPALFAAMLMQQILNRPKLAAIAVPLAIIVQVLNLRGVFRVLPLGGGYAPMLLCVFGTIGIARLLAHKNRL